MIFLWLARLVVWILMWTVKLFYAPLKVKPLIRKPARKEIDPAKIACPVCGHLGVDIKYNIYTSKPGSADAIRRGLLKLSCKRCNAWCHVEPVTQQINGKKTDADVIGGEEKRALATVTVRT